MSNNIAKVAALISDPSRSLILLALLGGRALTASELANQANISASTASGHLKQLLDQNMVLCHQQGRHRYYYLANGEVAELLERMLNMSYAGETACHSSAPLHLRYARSCYRHLAGSLAVQLKQAMQALGHIECDDHLIALTDKGKQCLLEIGIDDTIYIQKSEPLRNCMDWSERQFHLAGPAADAMLAFFIHSRWLLPLNQTPRQLKLSDKGRKMFVQTWKMFQLD